MNRLLMGIDLGAGGVKVSIITADGATVGSGVRGDSPGVERRLRRAVVDRQLPCGSCPNTSA